MADITLWLPENDLIRRQVLNKLTEESGELLQIVGRCLAQGIDKADPKSGKPNIDALADEIADMMAAVAWLREVITLPPGTDARTNRKLSGFHEWQGLLEAAQ
ncbi:hypothetical protein [Rhizobium sp. BK602]|uniref:hypothetical protein n=1 Tax=Rhizobium sp. BK602 TaxID=2586986 RepID=UPI00161CCFEF|nr:hypothetical protein [Rhizobium sp. BK602]MBB3608629.1 hypothetical protein [Rhizobium sp. BK602]